MPVSSALTTKSRHELCLIVPLACKQRTNRHAGPPALLITERRMRSERLDQLEGARGAQYLIFPSITTHDLQAYRHPIDESGGKGQSRQHQKHTSELQSLIRITYAVFCLTKQHKITKHRD